MLRKIILHPLFVFPVLACLVFWPYTFQLYALKNDALTYYYPVRTLISDALNNGKLPLWTPYINLGYPLHSDLQSGAWSPVIWIFSLATKYSLAAFHYELLFYIALAGIGFYYLSRHIGYSKTVAFTIAIAYQFSGFIIDSVQFFNCISAACYLPFVVLFFRKTIETKRLKDALLMALFLFLLFTGGYPSIFIITIYTLAAYFLYYIFKSEDKFRYAKSLLFPFGIAIITFILLSSPALISFIHHLPFIERGSGQPLSVVLENSMSPATSISLLSPFSTTASESFFDSNILMRSIYFGIVPLIFSIYALLNGSFKKQEGISFYFITALIMLSMAWGSYFFMRQVAYYVLPLMNSFRHPALFRLFFIFFMLLISGSGLQMWLNKNSKENVSIQKIIGAIVLVSLVILITSFFTGSNQLFSKLSSANKLQAFYSLNFSERFLLQWPVLLISCFALWLLVKKKAAASLIVLLVFAEIFIVTQFNIPVTAIGVRSFDEVEVILNRNKEAFPLPNNASIAENINGYPTSPDSIVSNPLLFAKEIGRNDVFITPGNLMAQDSFYYSAVRTESFKKPVAYLLNSPINDSIKITAMGADFFEIKTNTQSNALMVLQQNYYPGWKAFVNDKEVAVEIINITEMMVKLPAGKNVTRFQYQPKWIGSAFYISLIGIVLLLAKVIRLSFSKRRSKKHQQENETV